MGLEGFRPNILRFAKKIFISLLCIAFLTSTFTCIYRQHQLIPMRKFRIEEIEDLQINKVPITNPRFPEVVIMGICDQGYFDMTLNYQKHMHKLGLKTLFVSLDKKTHDDLVDRDLYSYHYRKLENISRTESSFGSHDFNLKGAVKFEMTARLLQLGYSVLLVDFDVSFFTNPFPILNCTECDIEGQNQDGIICVGIVFTRPTNASLRFYDELVNKLHTEAGIWDQPTLNAMLPKAKAKYGLRYNYVKTSYLQHGRTFFFEKYLEINPFQNVVAFHNNWVTNAVAKTYRAKEFGLWLMDTNEYYSSTTRRYITLAFPGTYSMQDELEALYNGMTLSKHLNRTLILPKFKCPHKKYQCYYKPEGRCFCSLAEITNIKIFDREYHGLYREHIFLRHALIPVATKNSTSPVISIRFGGGNKKNVTLQTKEVLFKDKEQFSVIIERIKRITKQYENRHILQLYGLKGKI